MLSRTVIALLLPHFLYAEEAATQEAAATQEVVDFDEEDEDDGLDLDEEDDFEDEAEAAPPSWDDALSLEKKQLRFQLCLNVVRDPTMQQSPVFQKSMEAIKEQSGGKATPEELLNNLMFQFISTCYNQLGDDHVEKMSKGEALSEEENSAIVMKQPATPQQLSQAQYAVLETVIKADAKTNQAKAKGEVKAQKKEAHSFFWYLYFIAIFGAMFGTGFVMVKYLRSMETNESRFKVAQTKKADKKKRRQMKM